MRNTKVAFSLIELMVVIAIVSILSAIAIPSYKDYVIRSKITESIILLNGYKHKIHNYVATHGTFPPHITWLNIDNPTLELDYIIWLTTGSTGILEAHFQKSFYTTPADRGGALMLDAVINGDVIQWSCGTHGNPSYQIDFKYLPSNCHNYSAWH